jgi:hypothetical protein
MHGKCILSGSPFQREETKNKLLMSAPKTAWQAVALVPEPGAGTSY